METCFYSGSFVLNRSFFGTFSAIILVYLSHNQKHMKTLLSLGFIVLLYAYTHAQPNNVVAAYIGLQEKQLEEAKEKIDAASEHEKTKEQAKTWYYRGKIYMAIYSDMTATGTDYGMKPEDVVLTASASYRMARSLNTERIDKNQLDREYQITANYLLNEGVAQYNKKAYTMAKILFLATVDVQKDFNIVDSLAMYNVALASENAGDMDDAVNYYLQCARMKYKPNICYQSAAIIRRDQGNLKEALKITNEALKENPNDENLLIVKINLQLANEDFRGALFTIDQALVETPNNADLHFTRGTLLESSDISEAMKSYENALKINPNHINALYNLGAAYYNIAVDLRNAEGATNDTALDELKMSQKYLEQVEALAPGNENVLNSLSVIEEILEP